jgi:hypothetical protein
MSAHAVEMALWRICYDDAGARDFRADSGAFLERFRLTPDERRLIVEADVRGLLDMQVNDMLIYSFFQALNGRGAAATYLSQMNAR